MFFYLGDCRRTSFLQITKIQQRRHRAFRARFALLLPHRARAQTTLQSLSRADELKIIITRPNR